MKKTIAVVTCLLVTLCLTVSVSWANWFATQRNNEGLRFLSQGDFDGAVKAFKSAILSYENYSKDRFSLKRAPLYYNLAQAYWHKMRTFPLLSRGYEYYWRMGLITAKKAADIQYQQPLVKRYFDATLSDLFDLSLHSGCKEVQEFLQMRSLVRSFENAKRLAMFKKCVNRGPSPESNILTIGPTEFSPIGVKAGKKKPREPQPVLKKVKPGQPAAGQKRDAGNKAAVQRSTEIGEGTLKVSH